MHQIIMEEPIVEGSVPGRDFSYSFFSQCAELTEVEEGIRTCEFEDQEKRRNKETEFRLLRRMTETNQHIEQLVQNTPNLQNLNRYSDILPYQDTIVKLNNNEYINANWISGPLPSQEKLFIATQGPLKNTKETFWKMVLEKKAKLVIMLTDFHEAGRKKCDEYFPMEGKLQEGSVEVELISQENDLPVLTRREFEVRGQEETSKVTHLQCTAWPDHGTPELENDFDSLNYLIQEIDKCHPVVMHCSAGIGRTGTLIALYHLTKTIQTQTSSPRISVFGTVRRLREQRLGMVQTKDQYLFIYSFMTQWIRRFCHL